MKLTPIDIKKQEFKKALRGFDPVEVKAYLDFVAEEYEQLLRHNQQLEKQVNSYQTELRHYKDVEKTLKQTLYEVKQTSQLSKQTSQKEAELIKREAEIQAAKMLEEAKAQAERIRKEVENLKQQKDSFVTRLKYLLSSQLELIEMLQVDEEQLEGIKEKSLSPFKGSKRNIHGAHRVPNSKGDKGDVQKDNGSAQVASLSIKDEPEIKMPQPEQEKQSKRGKSKETKKDNVAKDFFKDIFGEDLDVDDIFNDGQ